MKLLFAAAAAASLAIGASPASALTQGSPKSEPASLLDSPGALKPGQWVWAPELAPHGPLLVYVDLSRQLATVYRNGVRFAVTTVSSGKPGHDTPTGVFTILQKDADHHSSRYNNAPMPFTERLTWDGVALHAGGLPGYPSSHGCVHQPLAFARLLFGVESLGGTVVIAGGHNDPVRRPAAGLLEPSVAGASPPAPLPANTQFTWTPAASAMGPVSVVVSIASGEAVVLRGGIEIGRAMAQVPNPPAQTEVLTYSGGANDHWVAVTAGSQAAASGLEQLSLPPAFAAELRSVLAPGSTLVVTPDPISPQSTRVPLTIVASSGAPR